MAEDAKSSKVYRYLMEKAMLLFFVFDADGRVLEANHFAKALLGDVIGRSFRQVFIDFDDKLDINRLAEENASSERLNISIEHRLPQTFYFDFFKEDSRILALGQSDQRELEVMQRNLLEINTQLSNTTRMLQKANVELAELNELKNQFIGMAAHDMRSPIGQIMACSDILMLDRKEAPKTGELDCLAIIQSASHFLIRLIDDFLDISIIESGNLQLDIQFMNLVDLVQRNIRLNHLLAEKDNIRLSFEYEEGLPSVPMDPGKIEQVLNNLISNAMKFSEIESTIKVKLTRTGQDLVVSVQDEGPGISHTDLVSIFAPYAKAQQNNRRGEKSAGLGLAIAQKIIQRHKGRIWAESEPGCGATFFFSLPLAS